jgi:hypothetical protein
VAAKKRIQNINQMMEKRREIPPEIAEGDIEQLGIHRRDLFLTRMQPARPESKIKPKAQLASPIQSGHRADAGDECES